MKMLLDFGSKTLFPVLTHCVGLLFSKRSFLQSINFGPSFFFRIALAALIQFQQNSALLPCRLGKNKLAHTLCDYSGSSPISNLGYSTQSIKLQKRQNLRKQRSKRLAFLMLVDECAASNPDAQVAYIDRGNIFCLEFHE